MRPCAPVGDRDHDAVEWAVSPDDVVDGLPETVAHGPQEAHEEARVVHASGQVVEFGPGAGRGDGGGAAGEEHPDDDALTDTPRR